MQKVLGFGGIFFRAKDPGALAEWYRAHLGIDLVPNDADTQPWIAEGGATVFAPFAADTEYFPARQSFMLNFRVADLQGMLAQLTAAGISCKATEEMPGVGKFGQLTDPEGNVVELWQTEA